MEQKSKILLIRLNLPNRKAIKHPYHFTPAYNLKYLEACLRSDTDTNVEYIDALVQDLSSNELLHLVEVSKPQIMIIHVNVVTLNVLSDFIDQLRRKKQKPFIITVGQPVPHYSYDHIDIFLPGEADREAYEIIRRILDKESLPHDEVKRYLPYKTNPKPLFLTENLDQLPFPCYTQKELSDYHFLYPIVTNQKLLWGHILASRGCPYRCLFCSAVTRESFGNTVRLRSPQNIVNEMEALAHQGVNIISFDDDNFTTQRDHVENICLEIIERKLSIKWIIHARVDNMDFALLKCLKKAGCILIRFGIESGSPRILRKLNKCNNASKWNDLCKTVFQWTKVLNIGTTGLFVIGNPTETVADVEETIQLAHALSPDIVQVHFFTPYHGSEAYTQCLQGVNIPNAAPAYHYKVPCLQISQLDQKALRSMRRKFYRSFLCNPNYMLRHCKKYTGFYLNNLLVLKKLLKSYLL